MINELIGNQNGVVGGYVTVFKDEVEAAVNRVVSILKGTPPPIFRKSKRVTRLMF